MQKLISELKKEKWAYGLLVFGFIFRLAYIFIFTTPRLYVFSDAAGYDSRALQLANGQYVHFSNYFPPFFHIFLSLIYRPLLWLGSEAARIEINIIIFALLYVVAFWCIYKIAEKLFSQKIALVVLACLTFWYPFIFLNYVIMSENLFIPLFFIGLYIFINLELNWPARGILLGLCWGAAFLTRPIFASAILFFLVWAVFSRLNWKFLATFGASFAIIAILAAFSGLLSSNGGANFALLWCDAKSMQMNNDGYYYWFAPPANGEYSDAKRIFTDVPFTDQKYYYKMGFDCLKKDSSIIFKNIVSVKKLFISSLFPQINNVAFWQELRRIFRTLTIILIMLAFLAVFGIYKNFIKINAGQKKYFFLFALIFASLLPMAYLQGVGEERYIIPYAPLLMLLAAALFQWKTKRFL